MSLRSRVLVGMAVVAFVLAAAAVATTRSTETHLLDQVDARLVAAAGQERVLGFGHEGPGDLRPGPDQPERLSDVYVAVVTAGDAIETVSTPNLTDEDLAPPAVDPAAARQAAADRQPFTVSSSDSDLRYRALARPVGPGGVLVVVALPLTDVDDAVDRLVAVQVAATAIAVGVLTIVAWWVVHLGVRPIKRMTATATAIADGDLAQRVPAGTAGTEAGDLGVALNRMLGAIEAAFDQRGRSEDRLRRFVADASHELRTPVTTIRGYAELYRAGALADEHELREAMRRTEEESIRMGNLVDDLLQLARLDLGRPLERTPVDLVAILDDAARDAAAAAPQRRIGASTNGPVVVAGDRDRLRQVVANLVGNALVHTDPTSSIELRAGIAAERAWIEVTDDGPGMAPEVAEHAFERFYRADPSRSRHRGGIGLGLAIVKSTIEAHGGTVSIRTAPGQGTTVRIELPVSGPAPDDSADPPVAASEP